jgi:hypothetical protein
MGACTPFWWSWLDRSELEIDEGAIIGTGENEEIEQ